MAKLTPVELRLLAVRVLEKSNISSDNSGSIADALLAADIDGIPSHGVSRLPSYCDQALSGKVNGFANPVITFPEAGAIRVDAKSGFAYPAIDAGFDAIKNKLNESSISGITIANSHHAGVIGHHVERLANLGQVALGFSNSPAAIAPWGGHRALFGTNPIAFACPRKSGPPIVIDLSLSKIARGRIKLAAEKGEKIPLGWAVDASGKGIQNAEEALLGTLLPMGGSKGAALVLMVELLSAGLTGSNFGFEASSFFSSEGPAPNIGQFFITLNPIPFSNDMFFSRVEQICDEIKSQDGTRLPGERRFLEREKCKINKIEIPTKLINHLEQRLI